MKEVNRAYSDIKEAAEILRSAAGNLAVTDEETKLLKSFRLLNPINQKCVLSRIEGVVEGQQYIETQKVS